MKVVGMVCAAALVAAGIGGAHAQTCGQIVQLAKSNHAQVKAMRGDVLKPGDEEIQYKFKPTMVTGFNTCTIRSAVKIDDISDYWEHHLWCDGEVDTSEEATKFVESVWSCTKDLYAERTPVEVWLDNKYRIVEFSGEAPVGGRESGPVEFGETEYARVVLEKAFATSEEYSLHVYWSFVK